VPPLFDTTKLFTTATASIAVALFSMGISGTGCSSPKRVGPKQTANWAYSPNTVEIHPLSRFRNPIDSSKETMIVVHVEFKDGDGFACRGVGVLVVSLIGKNGYELDTETVLLQDENVNFNRFDSVTRTYQIRFNNVQQELDRVSAKAIFTAIGDKPIVSQLHIINNNR